MKDMNRARPRLLVVDDDEGLRELLVRYLSDNGYEVAGVADGAAMRRHLAAQPVDLLLLDVMLPGEDGLALARTLAAEGAPGIIMLSARGDEVDRIVGLEVGADDYLAKPFEIDELEARVRALLRRSQAGGDNRPACGDLVLDPAGRAFELAGERLALTPREFAVLESLVLRAGKAVAKDHLHERLFTLESDSRPDAIEVYVHRLRRKLAGSRVRIVTLRGLGYLLEEARP